MSKPTVTSSSSSSTSTSTSTSVDAAILMGSKSDLETMRPAAEVLRRLDVVVEVRVLSAHRTPTEAVAFVKDAVARGCKVFIAGAGGRLTSRGRWRPRPPGPSSESPSPPERLVASTPCSPR